MCRLDTEITRHRDTRVQNILRPVIVSEDITSEKRPELDESVITEQVHEVNSSLPRCLIR